MTGFDLKVDGSFFGKLGGQLYPKDLNHRVAYKIDMIFVSGGILDSISLGFEQIFSANHYDQDRIIDHYILSFDNLRSSESAYGGTMETPDVTVIDPMFHLNFINEDEPAHINYYRDGELVGQVTLFSSDIKDIKMIEIPSEHKDYGDINSVIQIVPN